MIVGGIACLLLYWLLPLLLPVPPVILTLLLIIGVIAVIGGFVLLFLGRSGHPVAGRRRWY